MSNDLNIHDGTLEVVASLAGRVIEASITELRRRDDLSRAIKAATKMGVSIDELSNASGITPDEIGKILARESHESGLEDLTGAR